VIRITIMGNMRPPTELIEMIRGGGWDSGGLIHHKDHAEHKGHTKAIFRKRKGY